MVIAEISGFDYVGLILKIDFFGLLKAKNRQFPVSNRQKLAKTDYFLFKTEVCGRS